MCFVFTSEDLQHICTYIYMYPVYEYIFYMHLVFCFYSRRYALCNVHEALCCMVHLHIQVCVLWGIAIRKLVLALSYFFYFFFSLRKVCMHVQCFFSLPFAKLPSLFLWLTYKLYVEFAFNSCAFLKMCFFFVSNTLLIYIF